MVSVFRRSVERPDGQTVHTHEWNAKPLAGSYPHIDVEQGRYSMNTFLAVHPSSRKNGFVRSAVLSAVISLCGLAGSAAVYAQSTAGDVFGKAPAGDTVFAKSATNGTQREVQVDAKGRYSIRSLPIGVYTVTLKANGQAVAKHLNVPVVVGRGIKVDFDCAQGQCGDVAKQ